MTTTKINQLCDEAESLYNAYQKLVMVCDTSIDSILDQTHVAYNEKLSRLKSLGVGGVLINGIFRDLYR